MSKRKLPYYSHTEVSSHCTIKDCWVSYFGKVYDLTNMIRQHNGPLVQPILRFAGQDISHWFDSKTHEPKTHIDPVTGLRVPYTPYGRYVHIPPSEPTADWDSTLRDEIEWWNDPTYCVGKLSKKKRKIKIINMLSGQEDLLEVCCEETLEEIRERYLRYNRHAYSYTWKRLGRVLNMKKTLDENDIADESDEFASLNMDADQYIPALHVHFDDDLTVD